MWGEIWREFGLLLFGFYYFVASKALCESWGEFLALLQGMSALKTIKNKVLRLLAWL